MGNWWDLVPVFVGAFLAFALGEAAARVSRRRERIEAAVFDLGNLLTGALMSKRMLPFDSERESFDYAMNLLVQIRAMARRPMRNAKAIRQETEELMAQMGAIELRSWRGEVPTEEEIAAVVLSLPRLRAQVFGDDGGTLVEATRWYDEHGLEERRPTGEV